MIFTLPLTGPSTPLALFGSRFYEADPRFSPDGRAIAFTSHKSGRSEVYLAPFPQTGGKTPVAAGTATGSDLHEGAMESRQS